MIPSSNSTTALESQAHSLASNFREPSLSLGTITTETPRSDNDLPFSALAKFLHDNAPVESFAILFALATTAAIKAYRNSGIRRLHKRGINMEDVSTQINHLCSDAQGNHYLIHRNLDVAKITDLIQDAFTGVFSKLAKRAEGPDYLLHFPKMGPDTLLREVAGHLPGRINHFTEISRNYHIFITCEDPEKTQKRFVRKVRIFLLDKDNVAKMADDEFTSKLKTERPKYEQRVETLKAICKKLLAGELKYGEDYCTCQLRIKTSDYFPVVKE